MKTDLRRDWTHEVRKEQRGMDGQWFRLPAVRFASEAEARAYAAEFARQQADVGGTRILLHGRGAATSERIAPVPGR